MNIKNIFGISEKHDPIPYSKFVKANTKYVRCKEILKDVREEIAYKNKQLREELLNILILQNLEDIRNKLLKITEELR